MNLKPRLEPGPHHPISVDPVDGRVRVRFGGRRIADTGRALVLAESTYPPVLYLPLEDVDSEVLEPSAHESYCPFKGEASYYTLRDGGQVAQDAVWTYSSPYDAVAPIAGHVAFYPDRVEIERDAA